MNITSSSLYNNLEIYSPLNTIYYENSNSEFCTKSKPNSWICFDFKNHLVIPKNYTIRSSSDTHDLHPKSWVIEGSNGNLFWIILDERKNSSILNGSNAVYTFSIKNSSNCNQGEILTNKVEQFSLGDCHGSLSPITQSIEFSELFHFIYFVPSEKSSEFLTLHEYFNTVLESSFQRIFKIYESLKSCFQKIFEFF